MRKRKALLAELAPAHAEKAAHMLRALANSHRLMILCQLVQGEKTVSELSLQIPLSQSALSQHLARLRQDQLVATRRESQNIHYRIADPGVMEIIGQLYEIYCTPGTGEPNQHLNRSESVAPQPTGDQDEKSR
ncbi:metalloregulator ArsR/SmtB family transcription factor [Gammaproteobacteria bacterium AB-CW1]|uniref:Metalloregulator ArsR/SmtB family transcription factor n=1 Tax=Natronospira elongata TaxID=3110268 RepID=A0AAP6JEQ5_9GAMM|nr:metalloregulator ArsR/SmtB family transcription factor [Gammaproteobacteria bacterium AB-CW1]